MGLMLKGLAVLVGLMLISLGAWPISALLFLYAASGFLARGLRRGQRRAAAGGGAQAPVQQGAPVAPPVSFKSRVGHPARRIAGVFFLGLSAIALTQGGTFSPLLFGGLGLVLLLWGTPVVRLGGLGSLRAVKESILLRSSLDPIHWFAIAEVKLATRQAGKALGGIDETLLVTLAGDGPSVFVVLGTASLSMRGAEESLLGRFAELARISAPLGAYLLPVDSERAAGGLLRRRVDAVELDSKGWPSALSTTGYDLLSIEAKRGGFVHAVGAYKSSEGSGDAKAAIPPARQDLSRPSLLWEVFQELGKKVEWQKPDGYTTFLASMFATQGETFGERVSEAGTGEGPQQLLVQSLGTPPVKMSRAQLRAIARVYS
ncbi:MAG: hypothetical protein OK442_04005 [Thaumarchaeota archaeon]|nr:hypothetical protein [Nitrososphaerota archaeon]